MVPMITVPEVGDDAHLLDVREPDEWAAGHVPGAQHLAMHELPARVAEIPTDRAVVVVCRVGLRSAQVVHYLLSNGFDDVYNLDGGMVDWAAAGRPLVSETGGPATVL